MRGKSSILHLLFKFVKLEIILGIKSLTFLVLKTIKHEIINNNKRVDNSEPCLVPLLIANNLLPPLYSCSLMPK